VPCGQVNKRNWNIPKDPGRNNGFVNPQSGETVNPGGNKEAASILAVQVEQGATKTRLFSHSFQQRSLQSEQLHKMAFFVSRRSLKDKQLRLWSPSVWSALKHCALQYLVKQSPHN
jgi:hypothetical protein